MKQAIRILWSELYFIFLILLPSGSGEGQFEGACECGNKPARSTKYGGISWLAKDMSASREGLCSMS